MQTLVWGVHTLFPTHTVKVWMLYSTIKKHRFYLELWLIQISDCTWRQTYGHIQISGYSPSPSTLRSLSWRSHMVPRRSDTDSFSISLQTRAGYVIVQCKIIVINLLNKVIWAGLTSFPSLAEVLPAGLPNRICSTRFLQSCFWKTRIGSEKVCDWKFPWRPRFPRPVHGA